MDGRMPLLSPSPKRVVIQDLDGMCTIVGIEVDSEGFIRPDFIPGEYVAGGYPLSLVKVTPRVVLYRELRQLTTGRLNESFPVNDFHPEQI